MWNTPLIFYVKARPQFKYTLPKTDKSSLLDKPGHLVYLPNIKFEYQYAEYPDDSLEYSLPSMLILNESDRVSIWASPLGFSH